MDMEQAIVYLTHRSCHHNTTPGLLSNVSPLSNSCHHSVPAGSSIIGDTCTVLLRLLTLVVEEMDVRK
jgi:hypothetical protein